MRATKGRVTSPTTCVGMILPSSVMNAVGLSFACAFRYLTPPAFSSASSTIIFTVAVTLFGVPASRPPVFLRFFFSGWSSGAYFRKAAPPVAQRGQRCC